MKTHTSKWSHSADLLLTYLQAYQSKEENLERPTSAPHPANAEWWWLATYLKNLRPSTRFVPSQLGKVTLSKLWLVPSRTRKERFRLFTVAADAFTLRRWLRKSKMDNNTNSPFTLATVLSPVLSSIRTVRPFLSARREALLQRTSTSKWARWTEHKRIHDAQMFFKIHCKHDFATRLLLFPRLLSPLGFEVTCCTSED